MPEFFQAGPALGNQYVEDRALRSLLRRLLPADVFTAAEGDLARLGERAVTEVLAAGYEAEDAPPRHVPFDAWGRRVDRVEVSNGWRRLRPPPRGGRGARLPPPAAGVRAPTRRAAAARRDARRAPGGVRGGAAA